MKNPHPVKIRVGVFFIAGQWEQAAELLADAAERLEKAGADGLVLCTNTMHKVASQIQKAVEIPLLHIADPTAQAIILGCTEISLLVQPQHVDALLFDTTYLHAEHAAAWALR